MFVMKDMLRKLMFFFVFIILLLLVSSVFQFVHQYIDKHSHYNKPMGDAVKVFQSSTDAFENITMPDRFIWFLWYGE